MSVVRWKRDEDRKKPQQKIRMSFNPRYGLRLCQVERKKRSVSRLNLKHDEETAFVARWKTKKWYRRYQLLIAAQILKINNIG